MRARHVSVAMLLATVLAAGCGIPVDHSPRVLDRRDLPGVLTGNSSTTEPPRHGNQAQFPIYLVRTVGTTPLLKMVDVPVEEKSSIVSQAEAVLMALIAFTPSSSKATANLNNAIPSNLRILGAKLKGDVLQLDLSHIDTTVVLTQQRLAFAEIVFTATKLVGIDFVQFSIAGVPSQVPIDNGTSVAGAALNRSSYHLLGSG